MDYKRNILITGGAGFIGSHVVRLFVKKYPDYRIVNLDKLTYAGNLANLQDVEHAPNYVFERADICDYPRMQAILRQYAIDGIIHLAAESHVDRSIKDPFTFAKTKRGMGRRFRGETLLPHLHRRGVRRPPVRRHPLHRRDEIRPPFPLFCLQSLLRPLCACLPRHLRHADPRDQLQQQLRSLPISGEADSPLHQQHPPQQAAPRLRQGRERARLVFHRGRVADTYNIGGFNEWRNIDLIKVLIKTVDRLLGRPEGASEHLITYVTDRQGHDLRYAIDSRKLQRELGWEPSLQFEEGIERTVRWYLDNQPWLDQVTSGAYQQYYEKMYGNR